jgi:hypothetical protein
MKAYNLVTEEFGNRIFISDTEKTEIPVTENKSEALVFNADYDNPEIKLSYWRSFTGLNLKCEFI